MTEKGTPLALVTGAAHRLGRALALSLARRGYAILVHYHSSGSAASKSADEIRALGVPAFTVQADLTIPEQVDALFSILDTYPYTLRVLVNSAAVMPRADVRTLSTTSWDATFDLNLRAPFLMAQRAAERMPDGGLIVNMTDIAALKAWSTFPAYTVSKAALESLTRVLAKAYAPGIRVNAIAPGLVLPSKDLTADEWQWLVDRSPLKHSTSPDDIVGALEFLISNASVTGQTLVVDGGYSLV